jgi:hypothetical protein
MVGRKRSTVRHDAITNWKAELAGVSFRKPHFPFVVQEEFYRLYQDRVEVPKVTPDALKDLSRLSQSELEGYEFAKLTDAQIRKARAVYFGMVTVLLTARY